MCVALPIVRSVDGSHLIGATLILALQLLCTTKTVAIRFGGSGIVEVYGIGDSIMPGLAPLVAMPRPSESIPNALPRIYA